MKNLILITLAAVLGLTACGPTKKDALADYKGLNGTGTPNDGTRDVYIEKEVIHEVQIPVEVPTYFNDNPDVAVIDGNNFEITFDNSNVKFVEGVSTSYTFSVRILKGKADFKVDLSGIDGNLELIKKEPSLAKYKLTWTPALGKIPVASNEIDGTLNLTLKDVKFNSGNAEEDKLAQQGFELAVKSREIPFIVRRTNVNPTIKVNGLTSAQKMGEVIKFTVDVNAPGTYTGYEPQLLVIYDRLNAMTAKGLEGKGSIYIDIDLAHPKAEKIDANTFRYYFVFDTKNNPVLPQYDKELKLVTNPTELLAHVVFHAMTEFGTSDKETVHLNIAIPAKGT